MQAEIPPAGARAVNPGRAPAAAGAPETEATWQVVLMGTGDEQLERELQFLPRAMPGRAAAVVRFDERLAHRLLAAADILVVPSRFEPCGLVALAALRYGAVPVVASTGGLRDIVSGRFLVAGTGKSQVRGARLRGLYARAACCVYVHVWKVHSAPPIMVRTMTLLPCALHSNSFEAAPARHHHR